MKIAIMGPIHTSKSFGGVATFDIGINAAFISKGHESKIFSRGFKDGSQKISKIYFSPLNIFAPKNIIDFKPQLIIASLEYTVLIRPLKKRLPKTIFITILHGFPTFRYGLLRKFILLKILKSARKHSHVLVSNSKLTALINYEIYGIKTDKIIHFGLSEKFVDFEKKYGEEIVFLYVGRLIKEKNVFLICELYLKLEPFFKKSRLDIVGDGPEFGKLSKAFKRDNIIFHGKKSRESTFEFYKNSNVFISLNPHEPFGLVYLEALLNKCKIICPDTGGQTEFLTNKNNSYFIDINDIEKSIKSLINFINQTTFEESIDFFQYFSFDRTANDFINTYKQILLKKPL